MCASSRKIKTSDPIQLLILLLQVELMSTFEVLMNILFHVALKPNVKLIKFL